MQWQEISLWVFHSTFWAFLCTSKAPFGQSLWSGHHWKDLFLLQKLSIDDANFGQKWWRQKWKKGQGSSWAVTGGTGVNGLTKKPKIQIFQNFWCFWARFRQISQIYHKRTHLLENWVTWLTHWLPELFAKNAFFGHFGAFKAESRPN